MEAEQGGGVWRWGRAKGFGGSAVWRGLEVKQGGGVWRGGRAVGF